MNWRTAIGATLIIVSMYAWAWGIVEANKMGEPRLQQKLDAFAMAFGVFVLYVLPIIGVLLCLP